MANAIQNMTATPRNRLVGMLADGVRSVSDFAGKPFGYDNPPGQMLMNGLGVDDLATVLDRASYGERMTTGQGQTLQLRPEVVGAAGAVLPLASAAPRVARVAGRVAEAGMANLAVPSDMAMQAQRGAVVYHGSPHTFDQFDMSKIGTGEGAQAYGHGLYFADSPAVANEYKTALAGAKLADGTIVKPDWTDPRYLGLNELRQAGGDVSAARAAVLKGSKDWPEQVTAFDDLVKRGVHFDNGNFYKVDLPDEHIAKMLDWDKPLSQQHPDVQKAAQPILDQFLASDRAQSGSMSHPAWIASAKAGRLDGRELMRIAADDPSQASQALRNAGIPGIKYLDQGSRAGGAGTSNYVVFDDALPKILERNGSK